MSHISLVQFVETRSCGRESARDILFYSTRSLNYDEQYEDLINNLNYITCRA